MKIISALAITTLSLMSLACGSDASPQTTDVTSPPSTANPPGTEPPTTAPPTTAPPTTAAPATDPPATDPPATDPPAADLPARPIEVDDGAFDTIKDLGDSTDLIVVGTVTDEVSLGRPIETNDPSADEYLGLTISVETVVKGEPIGEVLLAWDAYALDADGQRVATNVMNGIPVPHIGDQLLLFLRPVDDQFAALLHGFPTHTPVLLDGVAFVEAGTVTITDSTARDAAQLLGKTIDEITAEL